MTRARRLLFVVHGWIGLNVGLWLFVVCLSGALAVLAPEIEWLTQAELRIEPRGAVQWQRTYEALRSAYPRYQIITVSRGEDTVLASQAWTAYALAPDERHGIIRVDPYAARIVQPFTTIFLSRYVEQLHYYLYSPSGLVGFYVVTALAIPLLLSLVSPLMFQKGWWRNFARLRIGRHRRWSWSSLHRLVGTWALVFGLVISVTGIWYLVEETVVPLETAYPEHPPVPINRLVAHGPTPRVASLDDYVAAARRAFPELQPTAIDLPFGPSGSVAVIGRASSFVLRDRANAVFLDPYDASVIGVRDSRRSGWLEWWVDAADSLHFGYWGGLASKLVWSVFGLSLPGLTLTGAYLSFRRAGAFVTTSGELRRDKAWIHGIPSRSAVTVGLMVVAAWSCIDAYRAMTPSSAEEAIELPTLSVGPWQAKVSRRSLSDTPGATAYHLQLLAGDGRVANVKRASLSEGPDRAVANTVIDFDGPPQAMLAQVTADTVAHRFFNLIVEDWSGGQHVARIPDNGLSLTAPADTASSPPPSAEPVLLTIVGGFVAIVASVSVLWLRFDLRSVHGRAR